MGLEPHNVIVVVIARLQVEAVRGQPGELDFNRPPEER